MAVDRYGYETILINSKEVSAVPRRLPFYDSQILQVATAPPSSIAYFQNNTAFSIAAGGTTTGLSAKIQGRDTNVRSKLGTVGTGEKMYIFGFRTAAEALGQTFNGASTRGLAFFDDLRMLRACSHWEFKFSGGAELFTRPWRDIPVATPHPIWAVTGQTERVLCASDELGMLDLRVNGHPYELVSTEEFLLTQYIGIPSAGGGSNLITITMETWIMAIFEGLRVIADKA